MKLLQNTKLRVLSVVFFAFIAIGIGSLATGGSAFAATKTYIGATGGNFNTSGNWSPSGVPANGDDVVINNATGSTMTVSNNVTGLSLHSLTFSGSHSIYVTSTGLLTITGTVTSSTTDTTGSSELDGNIALGADAVFTDVQLGQGGGNTIALAGHSFTIAADNSYVGATLSVGQITGAGTVVINVGSAVSIYLQANNSYSGTTSLLSGTTATSDADANTIFGSSSITVSPTATLSLEAAGASWTFTNHITIQAATVGQSGFLSAQLYVWPSQTNQTISIPNITLNGNSRFDVNTVTGPGSIVNLAGITANGYCVQYGDHNNSASSFINGPSTCVIGTDATAPNTAVKFITANPFLVWALGIITAAFLTIVAVRFRTSSSSK